MHNLPVTLFRIRAFANYAVFFAVIEVGVLKGYLLIFIHFLLQSPRQRTNRRYDSFSYDLDLVIAEVQTIYHLFCLLGLVAKQQWAVIGGVWS